MEIEDRRGAGAMVLAAGLGSRLRPLTTDLPKPCVPFLNEPLLFRSLRVIGKLGYDQVVVNTAYQSDAMKRVCESAPPELPSIVLSQEETRLGTGGGVALAARYFAENQPILLLNGDVVSGMDLGLLLQTHRESKAWATLAVFRNRNFPDELHKVVSDDVGRVLSIADVDTNRKHKGDPAFKAIYTGTMVMSPDFIASLPKEGEACLKEDGFWPGLLKGKDIRAVEMPAYWSDIGTPKRYLETHKEWMLEPGFSPGDDYFPIEKHVHVHESAQVGVGVSFKGPTLVGPNVVIGDHARLEGMVCLGENCVVPARTTLDHVVCWSGIELPEGHHEFSVFWDGGSLSVK